jgi:hypothetical protein
MIHSSVLHLEPMLLNPLVHVLCPEIYNNKKNQICVLTEYHLSGYVYSERYLKHLPMSVTAISQHKPSQIYLFTKSLHEHMYNICTFQSIKHRTGYHSCNFVNSRLGGARIESRPGLRYSWLRYPWFFSDFSGKCRNSTTFLPQFSTTHCHIV